MSNDFTQLRNPPTEVWLVNGVVSSAYEAAWFSEFSTNDAYRDSPRYAPRLATLCHHCDSIVAGGNVTHDGKPWCGCPATPPGEERETI